MHYAKHDFLIVMHLQSRIFCKLCIYNFFDCNAFTIAIILQTFFKCITQNMIFLIVMHLQSQIFWKLRQLEIRNFLQKL